MLAVSCSTRLEGHALNTSDNGYAAVAVAAIGTLFLALATAGCPFALLAVPLFPMNLLTGLPA
jgi:hypothetical protein